MKRLPCPANCRLFEFGNICRSAVDIRRGYFMIDLVIDRAECCIEVAERNVPAALSFSQGSCDVLYVNGYAIRLKAIAHVDDRQRSEAYRKLLGGNDPGDSVAEQRLAQMLHYSLFPNGGGLDSATEGIAAVHAEDIADEMTQIVYIAFDAARRSTCRLDDLEPKITDVPLAVHATWRREEILAALGLTSDGRSPSTMREGVAWCPAANADAFLITLKKSDTDYSPTTMYRDFALSRDLFHWESQSTTSAPPTGQRYINHRRTGSHILLFVRETKKWVH